MSLGKQAKPLSKGQIETVLGYFAKTRHPIRSRLVFLLSIKAGLRARQIALLTWRTVTDAQGDIGQAIVLQDEASKGRSGRIIPMNEELRRVLIDWRQAVPTMPDDRIIGTERSKQMSPQVVVNMFAQWYADRVRRMLNSLRTTHVHHERGAEDIALRWIAARRTAAGRSQLSPRHAAIH